MSTGGTDPVELTADTALKEVGGTPVPSVHPEADLPHHDDETIVVVLDEAQAVQDLPHAVPEVPAASVAASETAPATIASPSDHETSVSLTVPQAPMIPPTVRTVAIAKSEKPAARPAATGRPKAPKLPKVKKPLRRIPPPPPKRAPQVAPKPVARRGRRPGPVVGPVSPVALRAQAVAVLQAQLASAETVLADQIAVRLHLLQGEKRAAAMAVLTYLSTT